MATCVYTHPNTLGTRVTIGVHMCNYTPSMCRHTCEPMHIHMDNNNTCEPMCAKNQVWARQCVCTHVFMSIHTYAVTKTLCPHANTQHECVHASAYGHTQVCVGACQHMFMCHTCTTSTRIHTSTCICSTLSNTHTGEANP